MGIRPGTTWKVPAVGLLAGAVLLVMGCGVPQADLDAAKAQLATEQQKTAALQNEVSTKIGELTALQQQVTAAKGDTTKLQEQVTAKEKEIADLNKAAGALQGATVFLGAKLVPTPTPRPTPTPPPPGFTPAPAPTPPAAFTQPLQLYIYADTVTSGPNESKFSYDPTAPNAAASCVLTGIFKRGMHLVWRFEIIDASTGKRLTGNEIDTAVVRLPSGEVIKGRFGRHGSTADAPWFWTAAWDVPLDYPLGVLDWQIDATTKDGKSGSFKLWKVSIPERGIESRTQIIP